MQKLLEVERDYELALFRTRNQIKRQEVLDALQRIAVEAYDECNNLHSHEGSDWNELELNERVQMAITYMHMCHGEGGSE